MSGAHTRLDASIEGMKIYFPEFSLSGLPLGTGPVAVWKGSVQPLQSPVHLEEVLDDIYHERPVVMRASGVIDHRPDCVITHCHHEWMEKLSNPYVKYKLEVHYGGGEMHPKAYVREPVVPLYKRQKHHFNDGALCAYPPWQGIWQWERNTVVDFMSHVTEWLVKWTVWEQVGVWIGSEMGHDRGLLLREIRPDQDCHCGSGKPYQLCHRMEDESYVWRSLERMIYRRPQL